MLHEDVEDDRVLREPAKNSLEKRCVVCVLMDEQKLLGCKGEMNEERNQSPGRGKGGYKNIRQGCGKCDGRG